MENIKAIAYKPLQEEIVSIFFKRLKILGFDKFKKNEASKSFDGGTIGAEIFFKKKFACLEFSCHIFGTIDSLENLLNQFRIEILNQPKYKGCSFGGNVGNIKNWVYWTWQVYTANEIEEETNEMLNIFEEAGVPFIEKLNNIVSIYEYLSDDKLGDRISPFIFERVSRILGLTYLMNRFDLFVEQSNKFERVIAVHPNGDPDEFIVFKDWLKLKFEVDVDI
jgi:hypothetical protein